MQGESPETEERDRLLRDKVQMPCLMMLEHDFRGPLSVGTGVHRRLEQEHAVIGWGCSEVVFERVTPNLFHLVPVLYHTVLHGPAAAELMRALTGQCLVSDVTVRIPGGSYVVVTSRCANDIGHHKPRRVVSSKASMEVTGPILYYYG